MAGKYGPPEKKRDYREAGQAWRAVLGRDSLPPVILMIAGSDDIYQEALQGLLDKVFKEGNRELNIQKVDAPSTRSAQCVADVRVAPMMAKKRVVCVSNADAWFTPEKEELGSDSAKAAKKPKGKAGKSAGQHDDLLALAKGSFKRGHILLRAYAPERRSALYKALEEVNAVFDFSSLGEGQDLLRNIQAELQRRGIEAERQAVEFLADALGGNAEALFTEMDKLAELVPAGKVLTLEGARSNVQRLRGHKLYELANAVSERRTADSLILLGRMFESLLDAGKKVQAAGIPLMILSTLEGELRKLAMAAGTKSTTSDALASKLGMPEWAARKLLQNVKRFTPGELDAALRELREADRRIKSTSLEPRLILEELVLAICTKGVRPLAPSDLGYRR